MCASVTDNILRDPEVSDNMGKQKFSSHKSYGWTSQWDESERLGELVCDTQNGGVALGHWRSVIKSTAMCDQVFVVWAMAGVFQLVRFVGPPHMEHEETVQCTSVHMLGHQYLVCRS